METLIFVQQPGLFTLIKLGGSIITLESGEFDFNNAISIGSELLQYKSPVVLVHGGGFFIKKILLHYRVKTDFITKEQIQIVRDLRDSLDQLDLLLQETFRKLGLSCISFQARSVFTSHNGELIAKDVAHDFLRAVYRDNGMVIVYGDVLDDVDDFYFCSSDKIMTWLAKEIKPKKILFLTNVDGVYEFYPPRTSTSEYLPRITPKLLRKITRDYIVGHGEIYDKLVEAFNCAAYTDNCRIINGRVPGRLIGSLNGSIITGTRVELEVIS